MAKFNGQDFFAGIAVGGALGIAAALLLSPRVNEGTRRRLQERGSQLRERAGDWTGKARAKTDVLVGQTRAAIPVQRARLQKAVAEGKKVVAEKRHEWRSKLDQRRHEGDAHV